MTNVVKLTWEHMFLDEQLQKRCTAASSAVKRLYIAYNNDIA